MTAVLGEGRAQGVGGRLAGKVCIVTGAASGLGAGGARRFAAEGATIVAADLDEDGAAAVAQQIEAVGGVARADAVDVTDAAALAALVERTLSAHGRIDVLWNNAGIGIRPTPAEDVDDATYHRIAAVNMFGVFAGCRAVIPSMKRQGRGVILNTASTAAVRPRPLLNVYNASKGFVLTLTKTLAIELAPHGIRVNAINPVMAETPMLDVFTGDRTVEDTRRAVVETIPLGRMSTPDDVAAAAVYLASDEAAMVTGSALDVDGGRDI